MVTSIITRLLADGRGVAHFVNDTPGHPPSIGAESDFEGLDAGRDPETDAVAALREMYPDAPVVPVRAVNWDGTARETAR